MKRFSRFYALIAVTVAVALLAATLLSVSPARALIVTSNNGIVTIDAQPICNNSNYYYEMNIIWEDEGGGRDSITLARVDGNGHVIGAVDAYSTVIGPDTQTVRVNATGATARPITAYIFDRPTGASTPGATSAERFAYAIANYPIVFQATDDPVALGITSCAGLPLVTSSSATGGLTSNPAEPFFQTSVPAQSIDAFKAAVVPLPDGRVPLAIFEPHWWGVKTLNSTHFPAVTDWTQAEVYCLDSGGNWTGEYVSTWSESEAVLQVYIKQHGICGIFPKS